MNLFARVWAFMAKYGQRIPADFYPQAPADEDVRNRCRWQLEETVELLVACFGKETADQFLAASSELYGLIKWQPVKVDLVAYADANADIRFVAYGNDVAAGIDGREIDAEVCRSNMTKQPPSEPGGKVRKGPNYEPPQIAAILREQGMKEVA